MNSSFPIFYTALFTAHETGVGHPENAGRLTAVVDYLKRCQETPLAHPHQAWDSSAEIGFNLRADTGDWPLSLEWIEPSARSVLADICRVHAPAYVEALKAFAEKGGGYLDADTVVSARSYEVALAAVSAWLDGVDWVWQHQAPAFALVRPPGHHAERDRAMGFCLLSNAAIAAHYALAALPVKRVAILDWDVHHGNGTQALVEANPHIAYCSFHQSPAYPGTGLASETGEHQNVLNLPMAPGSSADDYQQLWMSKAEPFLAGFGAELLLVSAGYDANRADPLASMALQPEDFGWFTEACLQLPAKAVLFGLEGGYDYAALASSVAHTLRAAIQWTRSQQRA